MATGGGPFEEVMHDQDLPNWSNDSVDDRLNNMEWGGQQKKANRSSEKNKKKFGVASDKRVTNAISPESSPGVGRRRTKIPHTFPHSRYMTQMSVPEQAELEKLKQRINFSDLDQRSIGSDSQGRATAANNKRQLSENRKPFNFLPMQINTNKDKDETETVKQTQTSEVYDAKGPKNVRSDVSDQEEDEESERCPVSINLSKAESQALTNYGSGEDENEDEEMEDFEESPVDIQTSLQANTETTEENEHDSQILQHDLEKTPESTNVPSDQEPTSKNDQDSSPVKPCYLNILENEQQLNSATHKDSLTTTDSSKQPEPLPLPLAASETLVPRVKEVKSAQETPESSLAGSPDTESPVLVNDYEAESGNISQKSDEEDFVKVEDLPLKLTVYSEEELRKKMIEEEQKNHLSGEICEMQTEELAGNSQILKEPETVGAQSI